MANTLFIRLEGPFQAWGERARWSVRDTATEPTKSGIVGLLGCALGVHLDEDLVWISRNIKIAVRCDRQGSLLKDFHTVIGGVLNSEEKLKKATVISWRSYLCDASFLVAIRAEEDTISRLKIALLQPVWPYFLGRKACVPSRPVYEGDGDYTDLFTAIQEWPIYSTAKIAEDQPLRVVIEVGSGKGIQRKDEIASNTRRTFLPRYTHEGQVMPIKVTKEGACI